MDEKRQNCCRLCLAPDNECISILNSYAADKEPLATKIYNCVNIKISSSDRYSLRVCHACISYLNSWQSFKNRCLAAQTKQRNWLDYKAQNANTDAFQQQQQHQQHTASDDCPDGSQNLSSSILDGITSLKKRKSLTVYPLPAVQIKDEPYDSDDQMRHQPDESDDMMVDPTLFLERTEEEGDEPLNDVVCGYEHNATDQTPAGGLNFSNEAQKASCRACNLKFSTRANARRHERTLHPHLFDFSASASTSTPIGPKPTSTGTDFASSLEYQRSIGALANSSQQLTEQRYRQEIVNAYNKYQTGDFDYSDSEKYRQFLTDEKIIFLQQNEEFLSQYQNMTCRCCNKFYATYKNFMAHMRKKYPALPRNLCFNCLKLNESKALFISHLKRRNCINLYKVLHTLMDKDANFAEAVKATMASATEKLRAKDLLVNKMYECKLCPKRFRLKLEFRSHVYAAHNDAQRLDVPPNACSFCGQNFEDSGERKRHSNNMECIVKLRCLTCEETFEAHQKFLDHVYDIHLANVPDQSGGPQSTTMTAFQAEIAEARRNAGGVMSGDDSRSNHSINTAPSNSSFTSGLNRKPQYSSRMPQSCPICGQQYNNYNNVLRHMESKHPDQLPQTYKCNKCNVGYPRLSNLREHMNAIHPEDKMPDYTVNKDFIKSTDRVGSNGANSSNPYSGRYDYVMKDLMSITNGGTIENNDDNDNDNSNERPAKKIRVDTSVANTSSTMKECSICKATFSNNIGLSNHMRSHVAAMAAARSRTPNSQTVPVAGASDDSTTPTKLQQQIQQQMYKRSLEQAADRRFRRMRCRICQRRFTSKKSYRAHMFHDHQIQNVQFIKCTLCDAEFAYEKGLKVHMFKIHNTLLRDDMIVKQYECDICSVVCRSEERLIQHKQLTHGTEASNQPNNREEDPESESLGGADQSGISTPVSNVGGGGAGANVATGEPVYWHQCKFCPASFNANKKLALHINAHDEFDSNDFSCEDCGNVYNGRKSLWSHRDKKHPRIPDPSECKLCKKMFFDKVMLDNHNRMAPICNRQSTGGAGGGGGGADKSLYRHKTGDDSDDNSREIETSSSMMPALGGGELEITPIRNTSNPKIRLPEVACTMCGQRFTDQDLFSKHIEMHEKELYTDNPLASMFDDGPPVDPNQFFLDRVNELGEYTCDLCAKTFKQMTALKLHRKWHFRGDSKQNVVDNNNEAASMTSNRISHPHLQGLHAVGLIPNTPALAAASASKSLKRRRELKCEYCQSTFISNNNLRRHIFELHKNEVSNLPQPPKIEPDDYLHCRRCDLKFPSKREWIDHKVNDAKVTKPFGPFQWGCDLCGLYVSRKEKLINHIQNHMKETVITPVGADGDANKDDGSPTNNNNNHNNNNNNNSEGKKSKEKSENISENHTSGEYDNNNDGGDDDEDDDDDDEDMEKPMKEEQEEEGNTMNGDEDNEGEAEEEDEESEEEEEEEEDDDDDDDSDEENENENRVNESVDGSNEVEHRTVEKLKLPLKYIRESTTATTSDSNSDDDDDDEDDENENDENDDNDDDEEEEEEGDDEENNEADEDADEDATNDSAPPMQIVVKTEETPGFACDLCRVKFDNQQELQKHVKMHFLNGPGSVSLTEIKSKTDKSRSSSSDVAL